MNNDKISAIDADALIRMAAFWSAILATLAAAAVFGHAPLVVVFSFRGWEAILRDHFQAIVGLPGAAFVLVVVLRQTDGPIEFDGLGFKFKGAGQVVMWSSASWRWPAPGKSLNAMIAHPKLPCLSREPDDHKGAISSARVANATARGIGRSPFS